MSAFRDRQIVIELVVRSGHPSLLAGLDAWLQLGLISDAFVRQLAQAEFSCDLPEILSTADQESALVQDRAIAHDPESSLVAPVPRRRTQSNVLAQLLQAFMAEISVVWLLFLGVFLVVVSSGVLAATQWQNFSAVGQYGILFGYTLAFGLASWLTRQRPILQLTSQMLTIATLLLIPVNFWMMDGFRLWSQVAGLGLIAIASLSLTGIPFLLLKRSDSRLLIATTVFLNWLHWGWQQPGIPLLATYLGTLSATAILLFHDQQRQTSVTDPDHSLRSPSPPRPAPLTPIAIALSATLLIGRAIFAAQVPIQQLGLAVAGCGWLLCWLGRRDRARLGWSWAGTVLLCLGWLVTVSETPPWQAIAISGLGLHLLNHALWQTGRSVYLGVGFLVGWQWVWLAWRMVPALWQTQIVTWATKLAGTTALPLPLMGLGFFPYVMGTAAFAVYLRRRDRSHLADRAEGLALALGAVLVTGSLGNPLVRSLTLTLASLTLIAVARHRRPLPESLGYLTHSSLLATLVAWIDTSFPTLMRHQWGVILLGLMALEWGYSALHRDRWEGRGKSAWHLGLGLASLSYALMWEIPWNQHPYWKASWLLTPILLTALSARDRIPVARLAGWFSILALILAQPLLFAPSPIRLASLGIATLLMLIHARTLQTLPATLLTVAFGLGFWSCTLWELLYPRLNFHWTLVLVALTVLLLWLLRGIVQDRRSHLADLYRRALDGWAIAVLLLAFLLLSVSQLLILANLTPANWQDSLAGGLLVFATIYRTWQAPTNGGWFAIAGSVELFTVSGLLLAGRPLTDLAIANIALGFLAQMAGNAWIGRSRFPRRAGQDSENTDSAYPLSWHLIPCAYGLMALWLSHWTFSATTGLYTLAIAILVGQIGRRSPRLEIITYLSLVGVSLGAFELLSYQLSLATGGKTGDGITLMAGLAIALTWVYHGLRHRLVAYLRLSRLEFEPFIQVHWVLGTVMVVIAVFSALSRTGHMTWTAILLLYALYALMLGRGTQRTDPAQASPVTLTWTYTGIWQLLAAIASAFWWVLPRATLVDWAGAIAAIVAVLLYRLPWQRWGWERQPWRQSAGLLPILVMLLTGWGANVQSVLIVAAFYAWLASVAQTIRFSYLSVLLADWAFIRLLLRFNITQPLWYAAIAGTSILYLAQVDPELRTQERYEQRHWVRCLAAGLICLTGFYQAETGLTGLTPFVAGFVAIAIEFSFIVLGLVQRVRAFLYVGTLTFIGQILWQLWRFIRDYSVLLWMVGIVVGLILIWVAATFEARRSQANALLQHWVTELDDWQ